MNFDWVVVGAGFTGTTFAERMATAGKRVLVIDSRPHVAGNAYDDANEYGILIHRYGAHIFHTNSATVWKYLSQFTEWRAYQHHVMALVEGQLVPIPFNLNSLAALFPPRVATRVEEALVVRYGVGKKVPILKLLEADDGDIRMIADYVYRNIFEQYTIKQWQLRPDELSPSVTARVPVSISRDNRYFQDAYQVMPAEGYTAMFVRMLSHPNIKLLLNCPWRGIASVVQGTPLLYTGAIDEFLDYRFGPLPYRSLRFQERTVHEVQHQPVGVINYPNDHDFTRILEPKILTGQQSPVTTLVTEWALPHRPGENIAYYPIPRDDNQALYARYLTAARAEFPDALFAGRLGDYQYYNMDQACARALKLASDHGGPDWP